MKKAKDLKNLKKIKQNLNKGWKLEYLDKSKWIDAVVPGNVHLDLLRNNFIPDPFFGQNEAKLQWISDKNWTYKLIFNADQSIFSKGNIEILFHGLDTYADIYLNGLKIISANNMFHPWSAEIKELIKMEMNELVIQFRSPLVEVAEKMKSLDYSLPADNDQAGKTSPHSRKAPYHYGWDWGPCLVTSGIWKGVELVGWDDWHVTHFQINNKSVSKDNAELEVELEVTAEIQETLKITLSELITNNEYEQSFKMKNGVNNFSFNISLANPQLWWPHGHGDQILHHFFLTVETHDQLEQRERKIGIRDVTIKRAEDERGESFEIYVNNMPIYSKGANWIPADYFVERLQVEDYKRLLKDAIRANMNTLRIWGGGIYEPDHFYELCDEMGIMVWQDFMFACSMYPADESFLESVEKEARYQVKRLKGHASIILWCGNNEVASAWLSWGWKEELPGSIWDDYRKLFHELLPKVCSELDPQRLYWPSSPCHGTDQSNQDQIYGKGDNHYWGVWHGGDDFDAFEDNVGRFMTEYGMQSFPSMSMVESFTHKKDRSLDSDVMNVHQKASLGTGNLMKYVEDYYRVNDDFDSVAGLSQIMQAEAIRFAVEAHRRNMPYCMGTLYWQFNDCWPVISWSSIDYGGNWKALHYAARKFFSPLLVSIRDLDDKIEIHVVNDQHHEVESGIRLGLFNFNGDILFNDSSDIKVEPFSSVIYHAFDKNDLLGGIDPSAIMFRAELFVGGKVLSRAHQFFRRPKHLSIPSPEFDYEIERVSGKYVITVRSKSFLCQLHLISTKVRGVFSDNYFDMLPGEVQMIDFEPSENKELKKSELRARTLYEMMN